MPQDPDNESTSKGGYGWAMTLAGLALFIGYCSYTMPTEDRTQEARERYGDLREQDDEIRQNREAVQTPDPKRWRMINFIDEFGDITDRGAVSEAVGPIRPMSFPYGDTRGTIMVNCNRAWLRFSGSPNLTGGDIKDGYTNYSVSVRVDGNNAGRWGVRQSWGDKDLVFSDASRAISAISSGSTFSVALRWYGESAVAFTWSLDGSSEMIQNSCD